MNLSRPFEVVTTAVDGDVLAALAAVDASFTGRELHRVMGRHSQTGVNKVLNRLVAQGIVERSRAGSARTYRLNRDHLLADHLVAIAHAQGELVRRLHDLLAAWDEPPAYAALFGSTTELEPDESSDLDLLLVHDDDVDPDEGPWADQLDELVDQVGRWTGNDVRPLTMSRRDIKARIRSGDPLLRSIRRSAVTLAGSPNVLRAVRRPA